MASGRVFQRPNSQYFWIAYYRQGKEIREVAVFTDKKRQGAKIEATGKNRSAAEKYLKSKIDQITTERCGGPAFVGPEQQRLSINDLLDSLEADYKLRNKWNVKVHSNIKPLRESFGTSRAVNVTSDTVSEYIERLREGEYTDATINRRTQLLGQAFKLAVRNKKLSSAPFIPHLSEVGNERQGFFEMEQFEAVVKLLPDYLKDFARCAFLIGWRKGALQSLRWSDVSEVITLRAINSKNRKPVTVPIEGELQELIERSRAAAIWQGNDGQAHVSEYVFHDEGQPVGDFRKAWHTACIAAGVGHLECRVCRARTDGYHCSKCARTWKKEELKYVGLVFHDNRRTAARNMVRSGVDQITAMKITGHETDSMFRRYAIVDEEQKREALAKTQAYLAANRGPKVVPIRKPK